MLGENLGKRFIFLRLPLLLPSGYRVAAPVKQAVLLFWIKLSRRQLIASAGANFA
jgi:hypothetical protein